MRHYVLTRSSFGPLWDIAANRRRFAVTRAVTARLMARQTSSAWTWVVLLDERDPLLSQRMALYRDSAPAFAPIIRRTPEVRMGHRADRLQRTAAAEYKVAWRKDIPSDIAVMLTRIDDDDGFALDAMARFECAAALVQERTALMLPVGVWTWHGSSAPVRHERNAMHTLVTPPGDTMSVYDYSHVMVKKVMPVVMVDDEPGWLWVRHIDTISGLGTRYLRHSARPISPEVRQLFPIDWRAI